ncbi:hypothetical protein BH09VER1_BH09VER1_48880 [soil metagenome]
MRFSVERLVGIVAGAMLYQFLHSLLALLGVVTLSHTSAPEHLVKMIPETLAIVLLGLATYGYLFHADKLWLHIAMLVWLVFRGGVEALWIVLQPYASPRESPARIAWLQWDDGTELVIILILIAIVSWILRKMWQMEVEAAQPPSIGA